MFQIHLGTYKHAHSIYHMHTPHTDVYTKTHTYHSYSTPSPLLPYTGATHTAEISKGSIRTGVRLGGRQGICYITKVTRKLNHLSDLNSNSVERSIDWEFRQLV